MTERKVIGVDFSGAENTNATWVTAAVLRDGALVLEPCVHMPRQREAAHNTIAERLRTLPNDAVAALDFPFGVPKAFIEEVFCPGATQMPDVWKAAEKKVSPEFIKAMRQRLQKGDLKKFSKCKRAVDSRHFPEAFSPLNPAAPQMFPMTFYGMRILHRLWTAKGSSFRVPPLSEEGRPGPVLLEVMPGAVLTAFGLLPKYRGYKSKRNRANARNLRVKIFAELEANTVLQLRNLDENRDLCHASDDCLDSMVAAIAAALWCRSSDAFRRPEDEPDLLPDANLEGCIYAPKPNE